ncbi:MAG TPA: TetR family transcriptional regulator [Panacibacter sp.]|nr:TetR family transcriptional regulator [Panacibacter sp.]
MRDKKDHIVDNALELFAEKGFEGTSIRELAAKAEVNVAMVNYYFGSKEKLFEQMVAQKAAYTKGMIDEIVRDKSLSDIEKIDHIIDGFVSRLFKNRKFHRIIHQELMLSQRENLQQAIVDILYPNSQTVKSLIDNAIKKGVFKKVDSSLVIATVIGTINHVLLSKKMCNKLFGKEDNYVPYEDPKFIKRISDHLKEMMHAYLLKNQLV